jgi:hypothetical protein
MSAWSLAQAMAVDSAFDELADAEVLQEPAGSGTTASYGSASDGDFVASDDGTFDLATPAQTDDDAPLDLAWDELLDAALAVNVSA